MSRNIHGIKVIAGKWRGRNISMPLDSDIRPTPNRVRETLFNWLQPVITGARCLDLYSGSGSLGIESLSRGAKEVTFVDIEKRYLDNIKSNIMRFGEYDSAKYICFDVDNMLSAESSVQYDVIFIDPPYFKNFLSKSLQGLTSCGIVAKDALIYCEKHKKDNIIIPDDFIIFRHKQYASVEFYLLKLG